MLLEYISRWLPVSHLPDPRYVGEAFKTNAKFGVYTKDKTDDVNKDVGPSMEQLKTQWGFIQ